MKIIWKRPQVGKKWLARTLSDAEIDLIAVGQYPADLEALMDVPPQHPDYPISWTKRIPCRIDHIRPSPMRRGRLISEWRDYANGCLLDKLDQQEREALEIPWTLMGDSFGKITGLSFPVTAESLLQAYRSELRVLPWLWTFIYAQLGWILEAREMIRRGEFGRLAYLMFTVTNGSSILLDWWTWDDHQRQRALERFLHEKGKVGGRTSAARKKALRPDKWRRLEDGLDRMRRKWAKLHPHADLADMKDKGLLEMLADEAGAAAGAGYSLRNLQYLRQKAKREGWTR